MRVFRQFGILGTLLLASATAALCEGMTVEPGDVLRVTIAGAPDIGRDNAKVDADGRIMLPSLGGIAVGGADLDTIRGLIADRLVAQDLMRQPTVTVEVASYRPFYIGGAVANPGAIAFEPGLTVRHALILAGGVDRAAGADKLTTTDLLTLKAKWKTTNYALLQVETQIERLQAELDHGPKPDFGAIDTGNLDPVAKDEIERVDEGLFDDRADQFEKNEEHMRQALALVELEIDVLTQQADLQQQDRALQQDQVDKARTLVEKGVMPLPRLQELEREASRLSRDVLDNFAYAARARQNKQTQQYTLESNDLNWRIDIRNQLAQLVLQRVQLRAESEVLASALLAAGVGLTAELDGPPQPDVVIHRSGDGTAETFDAGLDTDLRPGDVIEVSIAAVPAG